MPRQRIMAEPPRRSAYPRMTGPGPILIEDKGDSPLQKDELMYRSIGSSESTQNEGAKQRWNQAITMAKAGNPDAKEWLRKNGVGGIEDVDANTSTSWWNELMRDVPKRKSPRPYAEK